MRNRNVIYILLFQPISNILSSISSYIQSDQWLLDFHFIRFALICQMQSPPCKLKPAFIERNLPFVRHNVLCLAKWFYINLTLTIAVCVSIFV